MAPCARKRAATVVVVDETELFGCHVREDDDAAVSAAYVERTIRAVQDSKNNVAWPRAAAIMDGFARPWGLDLVALPMVGWSLALGFETTGRPGLAALAYLLAAAASARATWRAIRWRP